MIQTTSGLTMRNKTKLCHLVPYRGMGAACHFNTLVTEVCRMSGLKRTSSASLPTPPPRQAKQVQTEVPACGTSLPGQACLVAKGPGLRFLTAPVVQVKGDTEPRLTGEIQSLPPNRTVHFNFKRNSMQESGDFMSPWPSS